MTERLGDPLVAHGDISYTVVPLEDILDLAMGFRAAGRRWHSHVLSPGCGHNPYPRSFAVVVEDGEKRRAYIAESDVFPEVDRALVRLLHGADIMDRTRTAAATGAAPTPSVVRQRVEAIDSRGGAWHHHMHFPGCALSPDPSRWTIGVESDEGRFYEAFEAEPVDVLRELEVLYFAHLDDNHDGG